MPKVFAICGKEFSAERGGVFENMFSQLGPGEKIIDKPQKFVEESS